MAETLLDIVCRYTEGSFAPVLIQPTACGIIAIRSTAATPVEHSIPSPLLCLVLQGRKRVSIGDRELYFAADDSMLITSNRPMSSQIVQASLQAPYLSIALDLDLCVIADLVLEMEAQGLGFDLLENATTDDEVANTALRLMQLLDRPTALRLLQKQLLREIHFWLLIGKHGPELRQLGRPDSHIYRIARAVAVLRAEFSNVLTIERLATVAGMSRSSFHHHFKAITSLTPLQFQKQLRLIEGRRLIVADGMSSSGAAFKVGYESASHFARDYLRMFGLQPKQERKAMKGHGKS